VKLAKLILDSPEHVDSENIKLKIGYLYQLFAKCDLNSLIVSKIGKK
jgi:hypothetical protein